MAYPLLLSNLGSLFLGVSLSFAILFHLGGRRNGIDGGEGCLGMVLCLSGVGVALACYCSALSLLL